MNVEIKNLILENEQKLLKHFPNFKSSIQQLVSRIQSIKYDGVLYQYIMSSWKSPQKVIQEETYNKFGFKSSRQLINENRNKLDLNDRPDLDGLVEGEEFNQLEISSLADNYNIQVGMYYLTGCNSVIIKSTVDDNDRRYDDKWIKNDIILRYFMQEEKESSINNLVFTKKPNIAIFNALMEHSKINIYVFVNKKKKTPYVFKGIFHPCGLVEENEAFLLFKDGYDAEVPYENFDGQMIMPLVRGKEMNMNYLKSISLVRGFEDAESFPELNNKLTVSKRNVLQKYKIDLEVSLRGEMLVVEYEKNKLISCGHPELAERVENVTLYNSEMGYDIKSFDVLKNGIIKNVFIKVNSNVCNRRNHCEDLLDNENVFTKTKNDLKLLYVYDIYTDCPKFLEV